MPNTEIESEDITVDKIVFALSESMVCLGENIK